MTTPSAPGGDRDRASDALTPEQVDDLLDDIYDALGSIEVGCDRDYEKATDAVHKLREAFGADRG